MKFLFLKLGGIFIVLLALYLFSPLQHKDQTFYFPSSNGDDIVHVLEKNGYTVRWPDLLLLHYSTAPTQGWYSVSCDACTRVDFFTTLHEKKTETMDVVVYAGETAEELTERLANDMKLDQKKLLAYYHRHTVFNEGDIFAGQYTLARNADENTSMAHLLETSREKLVAYALEHFKEVPKIAELKALLTMASIIQKESNSVKEMPHISAVIYNRLEKGMKLQMDSTLNYGAYSHTIVTPERIKTDTSYYNTYKHKGLPLQPLSAVTLEALYAAKYPAKGDYLFFMLSPKGGHSFAATYAEHLENLKLFRMYQKERDKKKKQEESAKEEEEKEKNDSNVTVIKK